MVVRCRSILCLLFSFVTSTLGFAAQGPQSFTLDGYIKQAGTTTALKDSALKIKIQIMDPTKHCLLYEEEQTVDTLSSEGYFSIQVGSDIGAAKRTPDDSGLAMYQVFQNSTAVVAKDVPGQTCTGGTFTPITQDFRYMRVTVTPSGTGLADELSPDTVMDAVPAAVIAEWAESVGGFTPNDLLQVNAGDNLTQTNLENLFAGTGLSNLQAIAAGNFMPKSSTAGATLPSYATGTPPITPVAGSMWYDSGTKEIKYYDGSATQIVGTGGGSVTEVKTTTNLTVDGVAGGTITSSGTLDLANTTVVASTYPKVTVDAKGRVTAGAALVEADIPTLTGVGNGVEGDAIQTGTIGGSTVINTTGNITTTGTITAPTFSSTAMSTRQLDIYDADANRARIVTPNDLAANYDLTLPADDGGAGQVLSTNGTGTLSWTDVSSLAGVGDFMADGSVPMTGNFRLGNNWLSNDGDNEGIQIDTDGNIGVGGKISYPGADTGLSFEAGGASLSGLSGASIRLTIGNTHTSNNTRSSLWFGNGTVQGAGINSTIKSPGNMDLTFETRGSNVLQEQMRLTATGRLGIGTTGPQTRLEVAGTVKVGDGGETCSGGNFAGGIRYNGGNLQFCNGTAWANLGIAGSGITAITGDVTASGSGSVTATIANDAVTSAKIKDGEVATGDLADDAVTFAKIQDMNTNRILGRSTAGAGDVEEIALGTGLTLSGGTLDVTDGTDNDALGSLSCSANEVPKWNGTAWSCQPTASISTNSALVLRDTSGNFAANNITANGLSINNTGSLVNIASPMGANYSLTLPADDGDANQVLTTDGAGVLTWEDPTSLGGGGDFKKDGTVAMTGTFKAADGTQALPGMTFASDPDTGLYLSAPDQVSLSAGNNKVFTATTVSLLVNKSIWGLSLDVSDYVRTGTITLDDSGSAASTAVHWYYDNDTGFFHPAADVLAFATSGAERMRFTDSGNVGIGTTAPLTKLSVSANAADPQTPNAGSVLQMTGADDSSVAMTMDAYGTHFYDGSYLTLRRAQGTAAAPDYPNATDFLGSLQFAGWTGTDFLVRGGIMMTATEDWDATKNGTKLIFQTTKNGGTSLNSMVLTGTGLGISVSAPTAALHLPAGTAAENTAPLKLTAGPVMTAPEAGAIEFDGTSLFYTDSTNTRRTLGVTGAGITALTGDVTTTGSGSVTATIADDAVTFAKFQNIKGERLLGRWNAASGDMEEIELGSGLTISGGIMNVADTTDDDALGALSCGSNEVPKWNGSAWTCQDVASTSTADALVLRDGTGNFAANNITANGLSINNAGSLVNINSPVGADYSLTMPAAAATSDGQVLASSTAGVLSWVEPLTSGTAYVNGGNIFGANATIGLDDNHRLDIETNNTPRMTFSGDGKVGIGTTSPYYKFDVTGAMRVSYDGSGNWPLYVSGSEGNGSNAATAWLSSSSVNTGFHISNGTAGGKDWVFLSSGTGSAYGVGNLNIGRNSGGAYTNSLSITSSGKVGIGTADPLSLLDVADSASVDVTIRSAGTSVRPGISGYNSRGTLTAPAAVQTGDTLLFFGGRGYGTSAFPANSNGAILIQAAQTFTNAAQGTRFKFEVTPLNSTTREEAMRIAPDGNVGIGVTDPSYALDVDGDVNVTGNFKVNGVDISGGGGGSGDFKADGTVAMTGQLQAVAGNASLASYTFAGNTDTGIYNDAIDDDITFTQNGTSTWDFLSNSFYHNNAGTGSFLIAATAMDASQPSYSFNGDQNTGIFSPVADEVAFSTNGTERMRINDGGYVGIGTTNPTQLMTVTGSQGAPATSGTTQNGLLRLANTTGHVTLDMGINQSGSAYTWLQGTQDNNVGTYHPLILNGRGGNVGIGTTNATTALTVAGDIELGNGTTGTVKAAKELVLRQDGDTYGASILRLRNRNNENGAIFETNNSTANLVDFIFKSYSAQRNIRFEARSGQAIAGAPSFHIGGVSPDAPTLAVGDSRSVFTGKVGVGIKNPQAAFEVASPTNFYSSVALGDLPNITGLGNPRGYIGFNFKYNPGSNWTLTGDGTEIGGSLIYGDQEGDMYFASFHDPATGGASLGATDVANARKMVLKTSGRVGIGVLNPSEMLEVAGKVKATELCIGTDCKAAWPTGGGGGSGDFMADGTVPMTGQLSALPGTYLAPGITFSSDTNTGFSAEADDTLVISTSGAEQMRIDPTGNIGIGTTNTSAAKLSLSTTAASSIGGIAVEAVSTQATGTPSVMGGYYMAIGNGSSSAEVLGIGAVASLDINTGGTGSSVGVTGVSLGGPGAVESIGGTFRGSGTTDATGDTIGVYALAAPNGGENAIGIKASVDTAGTTPNAYGVYITDIMAGSADKYGLYQAGTADKNYFGGSVGIGTTAPSEMLEVAGNVKATSFISTSDARLKRDIATVGGLENIEQLRGVTWNWKSDGAPDMGVIAQEVEKVFPWAVVTDPNTGYKAVKYNSLIGPMIEAIKETDSMCRAETDDLRDRVAHLENENATLRADVESMKGELAKIKELLLQQQRSR